MKRHTSINTLLKHLLVVHIHLYLCLDLHKANFCVDGVCINEYEIYLVLLFRSGCNNAGELETNLTATKFLGDWFHLDFISSMLKSGK